MRVFDASLDTLRPPILVAKWLWALLTLARGGGIGRRAKKEANRVSWTFFLESPDHLVSAKACKVTE